MCVYTWISRVLIPRVRPKAIVRVSATDTSASRVSAMTDTIFPEAAAQADVGQTARPEQQPAVDDLLREWWDEPVKAVGVAASWNMPEKTNELEQKLQAIEEMVRIRCLPVRKPQPESVASALENQLKEALETGNVNTRSATGSWFYRELKLDQKMRSTRRSAILTTSSASFA